MVGVSAEEVTLDCRTCGACCLSEYARLTTYIPLSEEDLGRFTASMRRRLVVLDRMGLPNLGVKRHGRGTQKICTQHVGRVGHKSACSIYARRPEACREFEPGSEACQYARRDAGLDTEDPEGEKA